MAAHPQADNARRDRRRTRLMRDAEQGRCLQEAAVLTPALAAAQPQQWALTFIGGGTGDDAASCGLAILLHNVWAKARYCTAKRRNASRSSASIATRAIRSHSTASINHLCSSRAGPIVESCMGTSMAPFNPIWSARVPSTSGRCLNARDDNRQRRGRSRTAASIQSAAAPAPGPVAGESGECLQRHS